GLPQLEQIARDVFGLQCSLTALPGERDQNLRLDSGAGRSFLLKVQNPADDTGIVEMETLALHRIARIDPSLPVMRVVPALDGSNWTEALGADGRKSLVRAFTCLEGHVATPADLDASALREWGSTVARLGLALRGMFHRSASREILWNLKLAARLRP